MMAGRRPKPSHLKLVTGNPGKRPIEDWVKPTPRQRTMAPPAHLDREAKAEWQRVAKEMQSLGLLTNLDRAAFTAYCQTWSVYVHAQEALDKMARQDDSGMGGMIVRTKAGNTIQNPLIGIRNKALRDTVRYAQEFGFTPAARVRVQDAAPGAARQKASAEADSFFED